MVGRTSRRSELLGEAVRAFAAHGYDGTSVADLVNAVGMSKAAFGYHFESKEALLHELVEPLLDDLEDTASRHPRRPEWPEGVRALLQDYIQTLVDHRDVVVWIDGDKSVLNHPVIGERLRRNNRKIRTALSGGLRSAEGRLTSAAVLGTVWRPLRNLPDIDASKYVGQITEAAMGAASVLHAS